MSFTMIKDAAIAICAALLVVAVVALAIDASIAPAKQELLCGKTGLTVMTLGNDVTCQIRSTSRIYGIVNHTVYSVNGKVHEDARSIDVSHMPRVQP